MTRKPVLPPLNALQAAESAARNGSIAAAAAELGVTASAVSQQLRLLERRLGRRLFERSRRGVIPTDAGRAILRHLTEGFESLSKISAIGPEAKPADRVVISASASLAFKWLPGVLAEMQAANDSLRFEVRMENDPVDFGDHGPDLRIGYGDLPYTGLARETLVQDYLVPLCAPAGAAMAASDLAVQRIIHTGWGASYASLPTWRDWAALAGVDPPDLRSGQAAAAPSLSIEMAKSGMGLVLGNALFACGDLAAGRLIIPFGPAMPLPAAYMLCFRKRQPSLQRLAEDLYTRAKRDVALVLERWLPGEPGEG